MKLTVLGCSGSLPGPDSPASSYLVQARDGDGRVWSIVLDLGNGALSSLQRYLSPPRPDGIVITHLHPDHFMDLCGLYVEHKYNPAGPHTGTKVFAPHDAPGRLACAYGLSEGENMNAEYDFSALTNEVPFTIGPFTLTPYIVNHPIEAYAVRVEGPSESPERGRAVLTYSGDTDECAGLTNAARGADLFLCEAAFEDGRDNIAGIHMNGTTAGRTATEAGVKELMLTHLPPWNDPDITMAHAREEFSGLIHQAVLGGVVTL